MKTFSEDITVDVLSLYDRLHNKLLSYYETIWADKRDNLVLEQWLNNFKGNANGNYIEKERLHGAYLLSKFTYFGNVEIRELIKSVYRDLLRYPIVYKIRKTNADTKDSALIDSLFETELAQTRFLGMGNPSESGVHMLYYFRQENFLSKKYFIHPHEIYETHILENKDDSGMIKRQHHLKIKNGNISRYVFIDDFCGSGCQASEYLNQSVVTLKELKKDVEIDYLMLIGTEDGIKKLRSLKCSDNTPLLNSVEAIFIIDNSFKCFDSNSRYFSQVPTSEIDKDFCKEMCEKYGEMLYADAPLGFNNGQLMLAFFHNTPDNTMPIFWNETNNWVPAFKRFGKIY